MRRCAVVLAFVAGLALAPSAHAAKQRPVVAVLDSGVDLSHPAFRGALWRNAGEVARNGVDDDGNGFADDVHGADVVAHTGDPRDPRGHGEHQTRQHRKEERPLPHAPINGRSTPELDAVSPAGAR